MRQGAAEENGRELAGEHGVLIERMARLVEQPDVLNEPVPRLGPEQVEEPIVAERRQLHRGATRPVILTAREEEYLPPSAVVHPDERTVPVDRPRDGVTGDAEVGLDVTDELERI